MTFTTPLREASPRSPGWRSLVEAANRCVPCLAVRQLCMDRVGEMIESVFDEFGDQEWDRLLLDLPARVSLEIHVRFLHRHLRVGRILEVGAGPGRFTIELARMGCRVVVGDISQVQLDLNARHVTDAGVDQAVEGRHKLDVRDLSDFADNSFDGVVVYGGPLSYAFEQASDALSECLRVTRPGGVVVGSVMSLAGCARYFLPNFPALLDQVGVDHVSAFLAHGDQRSVPPAHPCRMFTSDQIQAMADGLGAHALAMSASNWLSLGSGDALAQLANDAEAWDAFLDWEETFCAQPGSLNGGTHLLFATQLKTSQ